MYQKFTLEHGLISLENQDILQDRKGNIWFSGESGICCYDGYSFEIFSEAEGMPESSVFNLYEDFEGRIWFTTMSSHVGYIQDHKIHTIPFLFRNTDIPVNFSFAYSIYVDRNRCLWVGTLFSGQIYRVPYPYNKVSMQQMDGTTVMHFPNEPGNPFLYTTLSKSNRLNRYEVRKNQLIRQSGFTHNFDRPLRAIIPIAPDKYLSYYANQLVEISGKQLRVVRQFEHPISFIHHLKKENRICVGEASAGLHILNREDYSSRWHDLYNFTFHKVARDHQGGLWLTTLNNGILHIPSLKAIKIEEDPDKSVPIIQLKIHSGKILGTVSEKGVLSFYRDTVLLKQYNGNYFELAVNPNGTWYARDFLGYSWFDPLGQKRKAIHFENHLSNEHFFRSSSVSRDGTFYAASNYIIFKEIKPGHFKAIKKLNSRIQGLAADAQNGLWITTFDGLFYWKTDRNELQDFSDKHPLLKKRLEQVLIDKKGCLWISTKNYGILRMDGNGKVNHFTARRGLNSNFIRDISIDSAGFVWVTSIKGLNMIDPKSLRTTDYSLINHLGTGVINNFVPAEHGYYLASSEGLFYLDHDFLSSMRRNHRIFLNFDEISIPSGKPIRYGQTLSFDDNTLMFKFKCIDFRKPAHFNYRYKLVGRDKDWIYTNALSVNCANLKPGSYTFVLSCLVSSTHYSKPIQFAFSIDPPFWLQSWFVLLCIISAVSLIYLYLRYSLKKSAEKRIGQLRTQLNKASMESRYLRAQMNPHFVFNALNAIQSFILKNDNEKAHFYLGKFGRLLRNTLENSKFDLIDLSVEVEMLEQYINLESMRMNEPLDYEIFISPELRQTKAMIPAMLIQPFVENAIRHGLLPLRDRKPKLILRMEKEKDMLVCTIYDNGIGRAKAEEIKQKKRDYHHSLSLSISNERLQLLDEIFVKKSKLIIHDLIDEEGNSSGTEIVLSIPLN